MKTKTTLFILSLAFFINASAQSPTYFIEADDANIQYMGRIDFTNPKAPTYTFPGVSISAKFTGTAISGDFKDYGSGGVQTTNYYNVYIDNLFVKALKVSSSTTNYMLASGLTNTTHTILVTKRTESSVGKSSFKGFYIEGATLETPDAQPIKKIEFIGDSWTCGYGNEVENAENKSFTSVNEDNYSAWGAITTRRLNTQYHCTAYSGRGMYRNNSGTTNGVVSQFYDRIFPDDAASSWDHNKYVPDVCVIHLGTNDFFPEQNSTPNMLDSTAFVTAYINFVTSLRGYYPSAKIVCVIGSSKSDWWPVGLQNLTRWRRYVKAVQYHFNSNNDNEVYFYELAVQSAPYGEDWHPAKHEHIHMADQITPYLQQITGWQDCASVISGNAYMDDCKICVGGNTGNTACIPGSTSTSEFEIAANTFNIFPNPAGSSINIDNANDHTSWTIFNQLGEVVLNGNGKSCSLENIHSGIYHIITVSEEQKSAATFIKK